MAITNINPVDDAVVRPGDSFSFDIDDTYTAITIEVIRDSGTEFAYDGTLGGAQAGYTVSVSDDGAGTHTFTVSRAAGWDQDPQQIRVVEDETGSEVTTTWNYYLTDTALYPEGMNPYNLEHEGTLIITQDEVLVRDDVTWIDIVGADSNVTVDDLGVGKVRITITDADTPGGGGDATKRASLDATYSPVGLWVFDGDLLNTGSDAGGDMSAASWNGGVTRYNNGYGLGELGIMHSTTDTALAAAYSAGLAIDGDFTLQVILNQAVEYNGFSSRGIHVTCERSGTSAQSLWTFEFDDIDADGKFLKPAYLDGNNSLVGPTNANGFGYTRGDWAHYVLRRESNAVDIWCNGRQLYGPTALGLAPPTDGGTHRLVFGESQFGASTGVSRCTYDSIKLNDSALSDVQIAAEFALTGLG